MCILETVGERDLQTRGMSESKMRFSLILILRFGMCSISSNFGLTSKMMKVGSSPNSGEMRCKHKQERTRQERDKVKEGNSYVWVRDL